MGRDAECPSHSDKRVLSLAKLTDQCIIISGLRAVNTGKYVSHRTERAWLSYAVRCAEFGQRRGLMALSRAAQASGMAQFFLRLLHQSRGWVETNEALLG